MIFSIDDLLRCISSASLLEVAGWPKPGNIHRTRNFEETRFEHLLRGISAIQPNFRDFCRSVFKYSLNIGEDYSFVKLGYFFREATREMINAQNGGNVLLGHVLILAPIAAAAAISLKSKKLEFKTFVFNLQKVIKDASVRDTIDLYEAIRIANPGGLGIIEKYDINDKNALKQLKTDKVALKKIFDLSKEYDLISKEYSDGFKIILDEGLPYFFEVFDQSKDINIAVVNTFLKLLSLYPDTLINRKSGKEAAENVSKKANEIVGIGGIANEKGMKLTLDLDDALQKEKGKLNPGTTADLLAGVILCALIFGLKF